MNTKNDLASLSSEEKRQLYEDKLGGFGSSSYTKVWDDEKQDYILVKSI